jgi:hypothetical protein
VGALGVPLAVGFGGAVVLLLLAIGTGRGWRMARICVVGWEIVSLLGTGFTLILGGSLTLTTELTGIALPGAILFLILTRFHLNNKHLAVGLLLLTGVIHLALVPEHSSAPPRLGPWFAADGAAFIGVALLSFSNRFTWWRRPAAALLLATILAYLVVVVSGREAVDDVGVATKLIELLALGLILWPQRPRFGWRLSAATGSLLLAITMSGAVTWAASLRPGPAGHSHSPDGRVLIRAAAPTDEQRAAAAKLVDDTRAGIERYTDVHAALADGYRPSPPAGGPTAHYSNEAYQHAGRVLDTQRPEALVYANTPNGPMLLGAMYMLQKANMLPPDVGGSLTEWHTHVNLCFILPLGLAGFQTPFGTCPVGALNAPLPPMLHVWTVANSGGPFGDEPPATTAPSPP